MRKNTRGFPRFPTESELALWEPSGKILDLKARVQDVTPEGFRAQTKAGLRGGQGIHFFMVLEDGRRVKGSARVVWTQKDFWGGTIAGIQILEISKRDSGRIRNLLFPAHPNLYARALLAVGVLGALILALRSC